MVPLIGIHIVQKFYQKSKRLIQPSKSIFFKFDFLQALRGLRVSWTKIDIRVDDFDIQICTSPQVASLTPPTSLTNTNSSWFLKALSESGPLVVHIHDRRYPHQRSFIKCPCPQCSPSTE
jgi:hypothetical protein